jgi:hypothetical protein
MGARGDYQPRVENHAAGSGEASLGDTSDRFRNGENESEAVLPGQMITELLHLGGHLSGIARKQDTGYFVCPAQADTTERRDKEERACAALDNLCGGIEARSPTVEPFQSDARVPTFR